MPTAAMSSPNSNHMAVDRDEVGNDTARVMHEAMLPVCSPSYLSQEGTRPRGSERVHTIINLVDSPSDWVDDYDSLGGTRWDATKQMSLTDYAVVVQAALLGQGIALGWLTVASHWLLTGALVPAADTLLTSRRIRELHSPRNRPVKPVGMEIRAWIIDHMRADIEAVDKLYPHLGVLAACYGKAVLPIASIGKKPPREVRRAAR
jgi:DNA-binding transcriptional LysR family regulator